MNQVLWAGGRLREPDEPVIGAFDHGLTVGDGVFETLEVVDGAAFALTRHLRRLAYSASRMGLTGIDEAEVRAGVNAVLAAGPGLTRLRITVTSGPGPTPTARGQEGRTVIVSGTDGRPPATCSAVRAPWRRNERSAVAGVKSTSYAENVVLMEFARTRGADEALVANTHGHLCEGSGSNIFIEIGGEILTPPLASGCLPGITRGLALEWGARASLPVRVAAPGELELGVLDAVIDGEAFAAVTSSTRRVQSISVLDGKTVEAGILLPRLAQEFDRMAALDVDPAPRPSK